MMLLKKFHANIIFISIIIHLIFISVSDSSEGNILVRRKRYVVFPEGSSFSVALCMTVHTLTPDNIFTEGLNWGISYDLPNESKTEFEPFLHKKKDNIKPTEYYNNNNNHSYNVNNMYNHYNNPNYMVWNKDGKYYILPGGKKYYKADYYYLQRRHRRDLYNKLEVIINAMGFDGRNCILRALCEASQRFMPKGNSLVEEMMRIIFTLPLKRVFSFEPEEHHIYTDAHKAGHKGGNCATMFFGCSFSLIDMALGKYNAPDSMDNAYPSFHNPDVSERFTGTLDTRHADVLDPRYTMKFIANRMSLDGL